jgi:hypothetical protein
VRPLHAIFGLLTFTAVAAAAGCTHSGALAAGQCRHDADCHFPEEACITEDSTLCGGCMTAPTSCTADVDCASQGATWICAPLACACSNAPPKTCQAGCASDAACRTDEICGSDHRCQLKPCGAPSDCPTDFACGATGCQRKPCSSDAECQGYCVEGACFEAPGACMTLPT